MKRSTSWIAVLPSLIIPTCFGMIMYLGLAALIEHHVIADETILRYLTGHPISKITVAMFLIGFASLTLIGMNLFEQFGASSKICLEDLDPPCEDLAERSVLLAESLQAYPRWMHEHYLWERLQNGLDAIHRTRSTLTVDEELKHLADLDLDRQQQRYSLVRILIWATPMLGFLGTVLGISQALGGINVGPDNDFQSMMDGLRSSLYVAFDTTALALTLSMILMFFLFLIERFESQLLRRVDQCAGAEIAKQFDLSQSPQSPETKQLGDNVLAAMKEAVASQTEIWKQTIQAAEKAWSASLGEVSDQVREHLTSAVGESVSELAHRLSESIEKADDSMAHRWEQWQVTLSDNARRMADHQNQLVEQTELVRQILDESQAGEQLEPALHKNAEAIEQTAQLRESLDELARVVAELNASPRWQPTPDQPMPSQTSQCYEEEAVPLTQEAHDPNPSFDPNPSLEPVLASNWEETPAPHQEIAFENESAPESIPFPSTDELPLVIIPYTRHAA